MATSGGSAAQPRPRHVVRAAIGVAVAAGVVILALAAAAGALIHTEGGLRAALRVIDRELPGLLAIEGPFGSLDSEFGADRVVVTVGKTTRIEIAQLRARLASVRLQPLSDHTEIRFATLAASRVAVTLTPAPLPQAGEGRKTAGDEGERTGAPPISITPPISLEADHLAVGDFELFTSASDASTLALANIATDIAISPAGYRIDAGRADWNGHTVPIRGTLGGVRPFPIDARAQISSLRVPPLQDHELAIGIGAAGSLVDLALAAEVASGDTRGRLAARLATFTPSLLRTLDAHVDGIDPAEWSPGGPHAWLAIDAHLTPDPGAAPRAGAAPALQGRIAIDNSRPGTLDAGRVPLRRLTSAVTIVEDAEHAVEVTLGGLDATLPGGTASAAGGRLTGRASLARTPTTLRWQASLAARAVDPAAIDTRLRRMSVDGTATIDSGADETIAVDARLAAKDATLAFAARARSDAVTVERAHLVLGAGSLDATGSWQKRDGRIAAHGTASRFDIARLVTTARSDLNGRFEVDGTIGNVAPSGTARVDLDPSSICVASTPCLAASGHVNAQVESGRRLTVDADFAAGSATLRASGAVAWPGGSVTRSMPADLRAEDIHVDLMVPALQQFDATAHGSVRVHADLAGAWPRPQIDADVRGDNLAFAGRTLEKLQATVHDAGGEGGALQAHVLATTLRLSDSAAVVQALDATLDGRVSDHTLSLRITTAAGATLDAQAQGGVTGLPATPRAGARAAAFELSALGWHGRLLKLDADAPEPVHLSSPAPFAVDASGWSFGPAAFDLAGGRAEDIEATLGDDTIKTRGTFHGLHPLHARALVTNSPAAGTSPPASVTNPPPAGAVPGAPQTLALDGSWHLQLGPEADRADGEISIARSGGDVSAGAPGHRVALGLTDLHLDLKLERGRFDVDGAMLGQRVGHARVKGHGVVLRGAGPLAWQLAPAQPFALSLDADLPAIEDVAPFAGDALQGIRLGGRLTAAVQVDGTPADPHARGRIDGKDLRVVWIDQDVRLENGTLAATVADATVTLGELRFSGTQRTRPFDGRAASHLKTTEVGFVTASGSFDVRSREGSIRFHAEHLPLLQRPDRWVVASGDGEFTASRDQVLLHGTVTADGGAIDFSRAELPSLSPDVTVRTSDAEAANAPTRMAVGLDLSLDFGPAFYLRGRGLDTRAEGTLRLRSDGGGLLRGNGSLSAQDGKFEGFGQNLTIQRGRLDFQGPIDNPGLDILALRDGLPVTVGVTITGTAAQPQVRVYSDPPLPDYEALSWLVLGRPPEQGGNDSLSIASAAAGLLGGTGPGLPSRLAHQIGIDQISVRSGELADTNSLLPAQSVAGPLRGDQTTPTTTQIVSVSKRIGNALTISYEQVASGAASVVQVSYQLSRRLSLLARAGTDNALDLVYTLSFD